MSVTVSYPGVYIQEEASGTRAISGVATSIAMFVSMAERGRMNLPIRLFSFADFEREFGASTKGELAVQVRQFYLNGGGEAWVMRIAKAPVHATVTLKDQSGSDAFTVIARDPGLEGNLLRVEIDYDTASPEETFNLTVFRSRVQSNGTYIREAEEKYAGLSMDSNSAFYVQKVINGVSSLITVDEVSPPSVPIRGISIAGLVLPSDQVEAIARLRAIVERTASIRVVIGTNPPETITLSRISDTTTTLGDVGDLWERNITDALMSRGIASSITVQISDVGAVNRGVQGGRLLSIVSADASVRITPAADADASVPLMLGAASGGIEGSSFGDIRPAPTGLVGRNGTSADNFPALRQFAGILRNALINSSLEDDRGDPVGTSSIPLGSEVFMYEHGATKTLSNVRQALDVLVTTLNENTNRRWQAFRHGLRLALRPRYGDHNTGLDAKLTTSTYNIGGLQQPFNNEASFKAYNVAAYTVGKMGGAGGLGPFQAGTTATPGGDGDVPTMREYANAYTIIEREVGLINLMVLPRAEGQTDDQRKALWGPASAFCERKRAFLLIDPSSGWNDIRSAEVGVDDIRIGVETRNSAAYWPRLRIANGTPVGRDIDPSGSIAGLMARIDGNRGVWKAPAGLEATIRGVIGVKQHMTDPENGVINLKALNAIRVFPAGVVSWGARTLVGFNDSGNIDDKYIPVRRTMLFIEESLYRGLRFAVFEPNDEPLWAQIRLAAGSFMNGLFRQGAFAGGKTSDAYFVVCDSTTTTPNDINLGIVNVIVAFAPLKPAEFVVLTVKQIAGQVHV